MVLEDIGLDLSTAIRMFLNKTVALNGLPFEINNRIKRAGKKDQTVEKEYLNTFMGIEKSIYNKQSIDEYLSESRDDRSF